MNNKLQGIVLETNAYQENDLLLKVLTRDYGLISLIAKGSQKMSAHNHYVPFSLYEFIIDLKENKTIFIPRGVKLIKSYYDDNKIKLLAFKNVLVNALLKNKEELDSDDYDDFLFLLEKMNEENKYCLGSLFFSKLIKKSGISPVVDGCVECGEEKVIGLSKTKGGFVCKNHAIENDVLDVIRLKKFRLIIKANFSHFDLVKDYEYDFIDFSLLVDFYLENSFVNLPAYEFYKHL